MNKKLILGVVLSTMMLSLYSANPTEQRQAEVTSEIDRLKPRIEKYESLKKINTNLDILNYGPIAAIATYFKGPVRVIGVVAPLSYVGILWGVKKHYMSECKRLGVLEKEKKDLDRMLSRKR